MKTFEEVDLLWKVGQKKEAMVKINYLLERHPLNFEILQSATSIYLDQQETSKAREALDVLKKTVGPTARIREMEAHLLLQEQNWPLAMKAFEELYKSSAGDPAIARNYAYVARKLSRWMDACKAYENILHRDPTDHKVLMAYREVIEEGFPQIEGRFTHFIRPQKQREYLFQQKARFWPNSRLKLDVGFTQEIYKKDAQASTAEIDETVQSHHLWGKFVIKDGLSLTAGIDTAYNGGEIFNGGRAGLKYESEGLDAFLQYEGHQLVREPLDGLLKEAIKDQLKLGSSLTLRERFDIGQETSMSWYRVDGAQNTLNGEEDLGHRLAYDVYGRWRLLNEPYLAVEYHFKHGHWDKAFTGAETVVDFLADEQVHSPGFYFEHKLDSGFSYHAGGNYNRDVKRDVDYVSWSIGPDYWINNDFKFSMSYDASLGDSGLSGSGDTQAINAVLNIYF